MTELNVEFFSKELERLSILENKYTDAWLDGLNGTKKFDRPTMKVLRDQADFYQNAAAYVRVSLMPATSWGGAKLPQVKEAVDTAKVAAVVEDAVEVEVEVEAEDIFDEVADVELKAADQK